MSRMSAQKHSYKEVPKKGDLVIFDFSGNHSAHSHIGLVTEVINSTSFKTVEGNTSGGNYTNGGYVLEQTRYISQVNCFIRPEYENDKKILSALTEDGAIYKYAYKDVVAKSSKRLKSLKKGSTVTWLNDDGYGWSEVRSENITGWIMNKHLDKKNLSKFKTFTLKSDKPAALIKNKKISASVKLKKGVEYTLICEIENGLYKGKNYIGIKDKRYYI